MTETTATDSVASDAELISQVRAGDIDSYGVLYDRHRDAAMRLARQLTTSAEADDLVSESFAKLLPILQSGGGPDVSFRAYLLTCVRRVHIDRVRAGRRTQPTDDLEPFDPGTPFEDPALDDFERAATARAFASLPERWQLVLWHTEVEGDKPGDIAPMLGMTANSVAALAYRAREGLRQAYLRSHLADTADDSCRWVTEHLGGFVRGGLSRRDHTKVEEHLDDCRKCTAVYLELVEVNSNLRVLLAPLLLGSAAAAGYLTAAGHTGIAATSPWWLRGREVMKGHGGAAAAAVAVIAVTAVAATAVIGVRDDGSGSSLNDDAAGSQLADDGGPPAAGSDDQADSDDSKRSKDRQKSSDERDKNRNDRANRDDDRNPEKTDSPSDTDSDDDSGNSDPTESGPDDTTKPPETSDPTTEPPETSDPTTEPPESSDPPETSEPTLPPLPTADLSVGPRISQQNYLLLLGSDLDVPVKGVQKVDTATMVVTIENLTYWNSSGEAAWQCGETGTETITCTLDGVDRSSDPQDLGLEVFTSSSSSKVTAEISASGYRDPAPGNNSVSTRVDF